MFVSIIFTSFLISIAGLTNTGLAAPSPKNPNAKKLGLDYAFTTYLQFDVPNVRQVITKQGTTVNAAIARGNFTLPNGNLLATVMTPGFSGETDFVDLNNVMTAQMTYSIKWAGVNPPKYGLVSFIGTGQLDVNNHGILTIMTDSPGHLEYNDEQFLAPGVFVGNYTLQQTVYKQGTP